jgi:hypothetical protein
MSTNVEERMRRALSARAAQITPDRLQPAVPPTAAPARRSWLPWWRSLLVVAAVLVAVAFLVRRPGDAPPPQVPNAPAVTVPSQTPAPSPSPSTPALPPAVPLPSSTNASEPASPAVTAPVPETSKPVTHATAEPPATSPAVTPRLAR